VHLQERYGNRWTRVAVRAESDPQLADRIVSTLPDIWAELPHAVESELCCTVADFLRRRTQLLLRTRDQGLGVAPEVAKRMALLLDWSADRINEELERYAREASLAMAWKDDPR